MTHFSSTGCSKQGYGRLLRPLILTGGVVPPGFLCIQQEQVNHDNPTTRETEGAELRPRNSASGGWHHGQAELWAEWADSAQVCQVV